jgi:ATP-binding cassette, subfamily B, bacterial PglK
LVFDEDTRALDTETESSVMQAINDLDDDLNTIMIAHRTTTFKKCDMTVKLDQGRVATQHSCSEVIGDQT